MDRDTTVSENFSTRLQVHLDRALSKHERFFDFNILCDRLHPTAQDLNDKFFWEKLDIELKMLGNKHRLFHNTLFNEPNPYYFFTHQQFEMPQLNIITTPIDKWVALLPNTVVSERYWHLTVVMDTDNPSGPLYPPYPFYNRRDLQPIPHTTNIDLSKCIERLIQNPKLVENNGKMDKSTEELLKKSLMDDINNTMKITILTLIWKPCRDINGIKMIYIEPIPQLAQGPSMFGLRGPLLNIKVNWCDFTLK